MTIRHRLFTGSILMVIITTLVVSIGAGRLIRTAVEERYLERVEAEIRVLHGWLETKTAEDDLDLQEFAVLAGSRLGYRVTLIREDGTVLADSSQDRDGLAGMENHAMRPEVLEAMRTGSGESRRTSATTGTEYYYRASRSADTSPVRIIRVALPTAQVAKVQSTYLTAMTVSTALFLLVLSLIAYLVVRRLSKPMEEITRAAERTADGDLAFPLPPSGEDEIGRLAGAVERMRAGLLLEVEEVQSEHRLLLSVLASIREGLVLMDRDHRILLASRSFREILHFQGEPEGRLLPEVVRDPTVTRLLEQTLETGEPAEPEIVRMPDTRRAYEVRTAPILDGKGDLLSVLTLLFDVTRLESLESVRREFVSNVSHELRTPLTSIQAFVETLQEGGIDDLENRDRFLEIIRRNTGLMAEIIEDLSDLNKIETGAIELVPENLDLKRLAGGLREKILHTAAAAGVSVDLEIPDRYTVRADPRRLEQILSNLLDNAVKFSEPGGQVVVSAARKEEGGSHFDQVTVRDTGIGIPSDSLEKVFNRFFRVDPARSREVPGTGLGLSIVKHLVHLHGGRVRLESELGEGTSVTILLPAYEKDGEANE